MANDSGFFRDFSTFKFYSGHTVDRPRLKIKDRLFSLPGFLPSGPQRSFQRITSQSMPSKHQLA